MALVRDDTMIGCYIAESHMIISALTDRQEGVTLAITHDGDNDADQIVHE